MCTKKKITKNMKQILNKQIHKLMHLYLKNLDKRWKHLKKKYMKKHRAKPKKQNPVLLKAKGCTHKEFLQRLRRKLMSAYGKLLKESITKKNQRQKNEISTSM